jgi:putative MATE family efflux protein
LRTAGSANPSLDSAAALDSSPIGRLLWHTCLQTTLSLGVYGIYALTNAWFVARGVGAEAVAAVNLAGPVLFVLGAMATTVGSGGASLVSRRLGADDLAGAARAAGNAFTLYWATAAAVTVAGLLALEPLLTALGARGGTRDLSRDYTVILLCGALAYTGFSSLVRAEGRQRFATALWVVAVVIQIFLDPLLIYGFDMGVRGAALGTVGGQTASAAMSLWFFFVRRDRPYRVTLHDLRPHGPTLRALVGIGAPSFLAGFGASLFLILVNNILAAGTALVAFAVCWRVQTFVTTPQVGISQGVRPLVGFNAGRRLIDRVERTRVLALRSTAGYSVLAALAVVVFAGPIADVFVDQPDVARSTVDALRITAVGIAFAGVVPLASAYFQSIGQGRPAYLLSVGTLLLVKVPLVLVLGSAGATGVWIGLALGEVASALAAMFLLHRLRLRPA